MEQPSKKQKPNDNNSLFSLFSMEWFLIELGKHLEDESIINLLCLNRKLNQFATPIIRKYFFNPLIQKQLHKHAVFFEIENVEKILNESLHLINPNFKFTLIDRSIYDETRTEETYFQEYLELPDCVHDERVRLEMGFISKFCNCGRWNEGVSLLSLCCRHNKPDLVFKILQHKRMNVSNLPKEEKLEVLNYSCLEDRLDIVQIIMKDNNHENQNPYLSSNRNKLLLWNERQFAIAATIMFGKDPNILKEIGESEYGCRGLAELLLDPLQLCINQKKPEMYRELTKMKHSIPLVFQPYFKNSTQHALSQESIYVKSFLEFLLPIFFFRCCSSYLPIELKNLNWILLNNLHLFESNPLGVLFSCAISDSQMIKELLFKFDWNDEELIQFLDFLFSKAFKIVELKDLVMIIFSKISKNCTTIPFLRFALATFFTTRTEIFSVFLSDKRIKFTLNDQLVLIYFSQRLDKQQLNIWIESGVFTFVKPIFKDDHVGFEFNEQAVKIVSENELLFSNWRNEFILHRVFLTLCENGDWIPLFLFLDQDPNHDISMNNNDAIHKLLKHRKSIDFQQTFFSVMKKYPGLSAEEKSKLGKENYFHFQEKMELSMSIIERNHGIVYVNH